MYVYVYLFCNCVKTSGILLECALQVYWKFGWIYSHLYLVKSRVKKFVISPTLWYVSVFPLHPDSDIQPLLVGVCIVLVLYLSHHRRVATFLAHRDYLILRLTNTPAYLFTEELLVDNHHHHHQISWAE